MKKNTDQGEVIETLMQDLPCDLTDEDLLEKAKAASVAYDEQQTLETEKKAAASDFAEKIKAKESELAGLLDSIKTATANKPVKCVKLAFDRTGEVRIVRTDTGETIEERPMDDDERQRGMFPDGQAEVMA